ncbi:MAG: hypothetical protein ACE3JQ_01985 [Paenisporosarcina sp.]
MAGYIREELSMLNQVFLAVFLVTDYSYFLSINNTAFPWFSLAGASIGLTIIVFSWSGTKYILFNVALLVVTAVYLLVYNWTTIFNVH